MKPCPGRISPTVLDELVPPRLPAAFAVARASASPYPDEQVFCSLRAFVAYAEPDRPQDPDVMTLEPCIREKPRIRERGTMLVVVLFLASSIAALAAIISGRAVFFR